MRGEGFAGVGGSQDEAAAGSAERRCRDVVSDAGARFEPGTTSRAGAGADGIGSGVGPRVPFCVRPFEQRLKMRLRGLGWLIVAVTVLVACGGDSSDDAAGAADPEGAVIEGPDATATPEPTAALEPTVVPTSTPTATPVPGPEAEVIAAWERYLRLSIEARGKNPSPEALDFDSYAWGDAKQGLIQVIADYAASRQYVSGTMAGTAPSVTIRDDGAAIVTDCAVVDLTAISLDDGAELEADAQVTRIRGRLEFGSGEWRVAAFEFGGSACDG